MGACLHLLLNAYKLIGKTLLDISSLHGQDRLKRVLLASQDLNFLLVVVEFVRDVFDLGLSGGAITSRVCSFPLREAGLDPKLLPVSFMNKTKLYLIDNQQMPFELGAKKAGLSLVRAFLHSVEGVRP